MKIQMIPRYSINVELDMASSLGIQDRQAPSSPPKRVQGPTITMGRIMVRIPMPEALNESMPLLGIRHRTTPRWSDHLITRLSSHLTTSRLSNHLESLSRAEKGVRNSFQPGRYHE